MRRIGLRHLVAILYTCAALRGAASFFEGRFMRKQVYRVLKLRGGAAVAVRSGITMTSFKSTQAHVPTEIAGHECAVVEGTTLAPALQNMRRALMQRRDTSSLIVIADFDRTLTAFCGPDGKPCDECHDIVFDRSSPSSTWSSEVESFWALTKEKFGVMSEKSAEEQMALTDWWWKAANEMMLRHELSHKQIVEAVRVANTSPRHGSLALLHKCVNAEIPVAIVSAGLTSVIEEFLRLHDKTGSILASPLVSIHANSMEFDERGRVTSFRQPLITTRNKHLTLRHFSHRFDALFLTRKHVLLLGDNINDIDTIRHLPTGVTALKIGFANSPDKNVSEYFSRGFDAVVTGDGSMDYVLETLNHLLSRDE